jgi:hypothetical protein
MVGVCLLVMSVGHVLLRCCACVDRKSCVEQMPKSEPSLYGNFEGL